MYTANYRSRRQTTLLWKARSTRHNAVKHDGHSSRDFAMWRADRVTRWLVPWGPSRRISRRRLDELRTLWTLDTSALVWWVRTVRTDRHWCRSVSKTVQTQVPNCLARSAALSRPMCRSVLARFLTTTVCSMINKSSAIAKMGDRLAIDMGWKWGLLCPFLGS